MAEAMNKQQPTKNRKEKKFFLSSLFVDAPIRVEPQEPQKVVVAGLAEAKIKNEYKDGFGSKARAVFRGEYSTLFKISLLFIIFALPFVLVLTVASGYFESYILDGNYNFMGDIGVGYPGGADDINQSVSKLIWDVKMPILAMLAGAGMIAAFGLAGVFYACKRSFFQDSYKMIFKTFFTGIYKHGLKFLLISTFGILIALAQGVAMLNLLSAQAIGVETALDYCGVVFSMLIGLPLLTIPMVMLSLSVTYEMKFSQVFKNALVIIANTPYVVIFTGILSSVPLLMLIIDNTIIRLIIITIMFLAGFAFISINWVSLGYRGMMTCTYLKDLKENEVIQVKSASYSKNEKPVKKGDNTQFNQAPSQKPKQASKKPQQPYSNPKKKKKNK